MKTSTAVGLWGAVSALATLVLPEAPARAQDDAAEMARKLQDPLATIRALMTDNTIGFGTGDDHGTSYGFQLQPVWALDFPEQGFTFIPRAVIPIMGLEPGTDNRFVGEPRDDPGGSIRAWGLGDSFLQLFFAPKSGHSWKWGVGPQFSLRTRTDPALGGPDFGAGPVAIVAGSITDDLSFSAIAANLWSFDGGFNTTTLQPILFYNFEFLPAAYAGYNGVIAANWKVSGGDRWIVPLGLSVGRTFDLGDGHGLDVSGGPYYNMARPDGAAGWQLRFSINWLLP